MLLCIPKCGRVFLGSCTFLRSCLTPQSGLQGAPPGQTSHTLDHWHAHGSRTWAFTAHTRASPRAPSIPNPSPPVPLLQSFWSRLAGQYGNTFYWKEHGESASILDAVSAVDTCLREEPGRFKCSKVQGELGEEPSSGSIGKFFGL